MENKCLTAKLIFLAIGLSVTTAQAQTKTPERSSSTRSYSSSSNNTWLNVESDGVNDRNKRITWHKNGEVYKIRIVDDKITEMYIDDKKVPEAEWPKYEPMVKELLEKIKKDQEQAERNREQAERDRQEAMKHREQAERDREQAMQHRAQAEQDRKRAEQDRAQAEQHRQLAMQQREQAEQQRLQAQRDREQAQKHREQAARDRAQAEKHREQAEKDRARAEVDRKRAEEDRKQFEAFMDDLVKEKIVDSRDALRNVQLSDETLIVNDKKQPAELHQKFKAKYLKTPGARFNVTIQSNRTGYSIERSN